MSNFQFKTFKIAIISSVLVFFYRLLAYTWQKDEDSFPPIAQERIKAGLPVVFAHLHGDEWALLAFFSGRPMSVLASQSEDGSIMAEVLRKLHFTVLRGSSSKGGVQGFLSLLRAIKRAPASYVSLAVDGPKGPYAKAKPGIMKLSEALDSPIVVVGAEADKKWILKKSWSKALIPKPFARVRVSYNLVEGAHKGDSEVEYLLRLENSLLSAKSMALIALNT